MKAALLFLFVSLVAAGSPPALDSVIYDTESGRLRKAIAVLDSTLFPASKKAPAVAPALFTQAPHLLNDVAQRAIDAAAQASINSLRMPEGLDLQTGYTYSRSVGGIVLADIDEDWSYRNRFQLGVSWDLRQYKGFGNRLKRQLIHDQAALDKMHMAAQVKQTALQETLNSTLEKYDSHLLSVLNNRIYICDVLLSLYEGLYRTGDIAIDKLFDISYRKKTLEGVSETLSAAIPATGLYSEDAFVFFRVNENRYRSLLANNEDVVIHAKEWEMENKKAESFSYWNEIRVIPFARYQYLDYTTSRSHVSNGQIGVNAVFPLYNKARHDKLQSNRQLVILQETLRQQEASVQRQGADNLNSYRRTEQRLKSLLWDLQRYENEFRIWHYRHIAENISASGIRALELLDRYLESLYTFYTVRIDYERQLQHIKHLAADEDFAAFVSLEYVDRTSAIITKPLSAYVWSKQHSAVENWDDMLFFAHACRIERLYIGYNQQLPNLHYHNLTALLARNRISPYVCISHTELLKETPEKINEYFRNLIRLPGLKGIHIDIEPHQFPDWKEQSEKYLQDLLSLLSIAKECAGSNELDLTIALPATYPPSFYEEITPYISGITLMIYNKSDLQTVLTTVQDIVSLPVSQKQIEVAIRPEDYIPDYLSAVNQLHKNERIASVALESLATLDEVIQRKPAIHQEGETFTLSFFEPGKTQRTVVNDFKSYKEAVRYFGNRIKKQ
ncbi:MAG: hypothetical protein LBR65_02195 [Culturomica sp.]|jgi:hypothetical protein|nr:hypothetical protein [Culturomica sp.]